MKVRTWLAALMLTITSPAVLADAAPLDVMVSIVPEQWLIQQLGGEAVNVTTLVRPGQEPADFAPSPRQIAALNEAALYFAIGVPFEETWLSRMQRKAPDMQVVNLREGLPLRPIEGHQHDDQSSDDDESGHGESHDSSTHAGIPDPHIWLDPQLMIQMAHRAADALASELPEHADEIRQREQQLISQLDDTTQALTRQLAPYRGETFMTYHPAWGYFADRFGLRQLPIELNGRQPTTRALGELVNQARAQDIRVIFVQEQFSQASAQRLAQSLNAHAATLDPLAEDYIDNLHRIADALEDGFKMRDSHSSPRPSSPPDNQAS